MPEKGTDSKERDGSSERRKSTRYPVAGAVSFQWKAPDGTWREATGVTRNIGKDGAFIECESSPSLASLLKLVVTLPTCSKAYGPVCLRGNGVVRHVSRDTWQAGGVGVCVEFQLALPMSEGRPH